VSVEILWGVDSEQTEGVYPLNPGGAPCHSISLAKDRPLSEPILEPFSFLWNSVDGEAAHSAKPTSSSPGPGAAAISWAAALS
jgi:hypothetical protein